ncbi:MULTISPECIES: GH1 family beta-glucosidase [Streptomyces]|uniref:GH1 family beta-glucosidase n=1 Tax=Streptomyces sp. SID5464 TaxID=2690293 RepID=UPI000492703E|nr:MULTISPECIES: GH1 family beta-glucosidase [Streptomyces]
MRRFPADFRWGVSTASYQIEGAVDEDGRGRSIWDVFSHTPGTIARGDNGDVACDHYHRFREDIALTRDLGVGAYRFSVAWPRIQPEGRGPVERRGIDFYQRLVDELLDEGVEPWPTLYHWDLPQALEERGGWRVRDTAERFAEYAALVHDALGDRVTWWTTLNEPYCVAFLGHATGEHAPGAREGHGALAAAHHLMVGHGLAVRAMRAQQRGEEKFGITLNLSDVTPASEDPADLSAAERLDLLQNRVFTDPLLGGTWPKGEPEVWSQISDFGFRDADDLALIRQPLDFLGVNVYAPAYAKYAPTADPDPAFRTAADIDVERVAPAELPRTAMGWPVEPAAMTRLLRRLDEDYALPPVYITENGAAYRDVVDATGSVPDPERIEFVDAHLGALQAAMAEGVDVRGYFCWSLLDNFEWAYGYAKRFGLVYVDYDDLRRIPKSSYYWYRDMIRAQRAG